MTQTMLVLAIVFNLVLTGVSVYLIWTALRIIAKARRMEERIREREARRR